MDSDKDSPSPIPSTSAQAKFMQETNNKSSNGQRNDSESVTTIKDIKQSDPNNSDSGSRSSSISSTSDNDLLLPKFVRNSKGQNNQHKHYFSGLEPGTSNLKRKTSFHGLSRRQILTIFIVGLSDFVGAILISNQSPWYPIEASEKGLNATAFGFVFGAFELAVFIASPIFQAQMRSDAITPQTLFHLGIFVTSSCGIIFSFLGYVTSTNLFLTLSIVIRVIEGIGEAALLNGSFAVIAIEFKEFTASTLVSLETFFGLGILAGPPLGGALWDWLKGPERFTLTFGVFGAVLFGVAILGLFVLPQRNNDLQELEGRGVGSNGSGIRVFSLLGVPYFPLISFTVLSTAMSIGYLYVTLSLHLIPFNLHPVLLGGIFILNGGTAALLAPIFSWMIERTAGPKYYMCIGAFFIALGYSVIGPASYIPLETSPWLVSIGLFSQGVGLGMIISSTFKFSLDQAIKHGYANNPVTYGCISSFWAALFSLGACIGAVGGGALYDWVGLRSSSWIIIDFQIVVIIFTLTSIIASCIEKRHRNQYHENSPSKPFDTESEPLLNTSTFSSLHRKGQPVGTLKKIYSEPSFRESLSKVNYGSASGLDK